LAFEPPTGEQVLDGSWTLAAFGEAVASAAGWAGPFGSLEEEQARYNFARRELNPFDRKGWANVYARAFAAARHHGVPGPNCPRGMLIA
jgi:hypothetical protein